MAEGTRDWMRRTYTAPDDARASSGGEGVSLEQARETLVAEIRQVTAEIENALATGMSLVTGAPASNYRTNIEEIKKNISGSTEVEDKKYLDEVLQTLIQMEAVASYVAGGPGLPGVAADFLIPIKMNAERCVAYTAQIRDNRAVVTGLTALFQRHKPLTPQEIQALAVQQGEKWVRVAEKSNQLTRCYYVYDRKTRNFVERTISKDDRRFGYFVEGKRVFPIPLTHQAAYKTWHDAMVARFADFKDGVHNPQEQSGPRGSDTGGAGARREQKDTKTDAEYIREGREYFSKTYSGEDHNAVKYAVGNGLYDLACLQVGKNTHARRDVLGRMTYTTQFSRVRDEYERRKREREARMRREQTERGEREREDARRKAEQDAREQADKERRSREEREKRESEDALQRGRTFFASMFPEVEPGDVESDVGVLIYNRALEQVGRGLHQFAEEVSGAFGIGSRGRRVTFTAEYTAVLRAYERRKQEREGPEKRKRTIENGQRALEGVLGDIHHSTVQTFEQFRNLANDTTQQPFSSEDLERALFVFGALGSSYQHPVFANVRTQPDIHQREKESVGKVRAEVNRLVREVDVQQSVRRGESMMQRERGDELAEIQRVFRDTDPARIVAQGVWTGTPYSISALQAYEMYLQWYTRGGGRRAGEETQAYNAVERALEGFRAGQRHRSEVERYDERVRDAWFMHACELLGSDRVEVLGASIDGGTITPEEYYEYMCLVGQHESIQMPTGLSARDEALYKKVSSV